MLKNPAKYLVYIPTFFIFILLPLSEAQAQNKKSTSFFTAISHSLDYLYSSPFPREHVERVPTQPFPSLPGEDFYVDQNTKAAFRQNLLNFSTASLVTHGCPADYIAEMIGGINTEGSLSEAEFEAFFLSLSIVLLDSSAPRPDVRNARKYQAWLRSSFDIVDELARTGTFRGNEAWEAQYIVNASHQLMMTELALDGTISEPWLVILENECGGGVDLDAVKFSTSPSGGSIEIIGEFWFQLCQAEGFDPWDVGVCSYWQDVSRLSAPVELVGIFRYAASWSGGFQKSGRFEVQPGEFENQRTLEFKVSR